MKVSKKGLSIIIILSFIFLVCVSCRSTFDRLITVEIGIKSISNGLPEILLKKTMGGSREEFGFRQGFLDRRITGRLFIASTLDELDYLQTNIFYLPYFYTFSSDFFQENYLVFILESYTSSGFLRRERIEVNNDEYVFVAEHWRFGRPLFGMSRARSLFIVLYVLQLPKSTNLP